MLRAHLGTGVAMLAGSVTLLTVVAPPLWVFILVVAGTAVAQHGRDVETPIATVLLVITAIGLYGTLPDTEGALGLLGVTIAAAGWAWTDRLTEFRSGGWLACVLIVLGIVAIDAQRPGAVVGGTACLGLFLVLPGLPPARPRAIWCAAVITSHAAYVIFASRGAGLERTAAAAGSRLLVPTAALAIVAVMLGIAGRLEPGDPAVEV